MHQRAVQIEAIELPEDFASQRIIADAADDVGVRPQHFGVVGEIGRRTAELFAVGEQVPQHFAQSDHQRLMCLPHDGPPQML